jgi:ParB family transcriptional regulator, chromosome partitioning protein
LSKTTSLISSIPGIFEDISISKLRVSSRLLRSGSLADIPELADSISENGLLQPLVVRPANDRFEIVAGNRRYKACQTLKWKRIACHIVDLDDKHAFEFSLIENVQRQTLSVLEEGQAYKRYVADFGWGGVSELARKIGKSPSYITKKIKLLNLPENILNAITETSLSPSVAEELSLVKDQSKQSELAALIIKRHLSLRKARQLMNQYHDNDSAAYFSYDDNLEQMQRTFDKLILILRMAMGNIASLLENNENDWLIQEVFMQHKNRLHDEIDLLIKEKRKLNHRLFLHNH